MGIDASEIKGPRGAISREGMRTLAEAGARIEEGKAGREIKEVLKGERDPIRDLLQRILG